MNKAFTALMTVGTKLQDVPIVYAQDLDTWVRFGTHDIVVAKEVCDYPLRMQSEIVLDVGAHIGAFSRRAIRLGAFKIFAVEPDRGNQSMIQINAPAAVLFPGAIGANKLYTTRDGHNSGQFTTVAPSSTETPREFVEVPMISWKQLLEETKPTVIKMDIEGAEYDFLNGETLPSSVGQIAMEMHLHRLDWRQKAMKLIESFKKWKCTARPNVTAKWQTLVAWER